MIQLFLEQADSTGGRDDESTHPVISLLNQLGETIWKAIVAAGCRSEARLWLCNTISRLSTLPRRGQRDIFVSLLRSEPRGRTIGSLLLQMMFDKRPDMTGPVIARRSHLLEQFFKGNPGRVHEWFSSFDSSGGSDHKKGAKALSQFAFVNRDICWEELQWKGKHGQSPAMVATKPHYFLDLDIQRTMENFIEYLPEFWSSTEFAESLRDGEILSVDSVYFLELFIDFMYQENARDVWEVVSDFLLEEPFSALCQRLLIGLEESDFSIFLKLFGDYMRTTMNYKESDTSSHWMEIVLSKYKDYASIDQLLLLNAVISQGRQLLRVIYDEECRGEKKKIRDIILEISKYLKDAKSFVSFLEESKRKKTVEVMKLIGLQSWVVHYRLSEECLDTDSWESLFITNGIKFRTSGKYSILQYESEDDSMTDLDGKASNVFRRRKKNRKRKKRGRSNEYNDDGDDLLDFDMINEGQGLQTGGASWLLSTDGFSSSWTAVDLPEHLANHCFNAWIKQITLQLTARANTR
ncbi:hypothetical protein SAY87_000878 [Trapa incisa]|uniref:Uncharacterized protein n=1 Tax=Trapa incisa TaxID=236973 RepID=A0AAN7GNR7_9MYRT|nr:hypothetical protein SAY87_000878 [Trapa incisa]